MSKEEGASPDVLRKHFQNRKLYVRLGLILLLTFAGVLMVFKRFAGEISLPLLRAELGRWDLRFVLVACGFVFLYLLMRACRVALLVRQLGRRVSFPHMVRIILVNTFLSTVTPFTAGGIPAQVYLLSRYGLSVAEASSIAFLEGAYTWFFFVVFVGPLILLLPPELKVTVYPWSWLAIGVALVFSVTVVFITFRTKVAGELFRRLGKGLEEHKRPVLRFLSSALDKFGTFVLQVGEALTQGQLLRPGCLLPAFVTTLGMWLAIFMVAPMLLRATGANTPWQTCLGLQLIHSCVAPLIPTPGGSGGTELLLASLFAPLLSGTNLGAFVATWRLLSYYLPLGLGGLATLVQIQLLFREG